MQKLISTTSYMTRTLLQEFYKEKLTTEMLAKEVSHGYLIRKFSYYVPTMKLLRKLNLIPDEVKITDFGQLAKENFFSRKKIQVIFECDDDVAKIIIAKYFDKKHNSYYKNDLLMDIISDGEEVLEL